MKTKRDMGYSNRLNDFKCIIVTGGAGFIGSNFILMLLKEKPKCRVICMDSLTKESNEIALNIALKNHNFIFYKTDINDINKVNAIFEKENPDCVVNFAAETHVDKSINEPLLFLKTNVLGCSILMNAAIKYGVKRFHQVSTDEVYGDLSLDDKHTSFTEKSEIRPSSPYSASKASADLLALSYYRTFGLPVTISRCSNNYGPYQSSNKLVPTIIINAMQNKSCPLYGDGKNVRNWIFVQDHCRGILSVLENGKIGEIYNFAGFDEFSNLQIANCILEELNKPKSLIRYVEDRKGHDLKYSVNYSKATKELGWLPSVSFDDGIKITIEWYKKNGIC